MKLIFEGNRKRGRIAVIDIESMFEFNEIIGHIHWENKSALFEPRAVVITTEQMQLIAGKMEKIEKVGTNIFNLEEM